jgi:hypothetical protein
MATGSNQTWVSKVGKQSIHVENEMTREETIEAIRIMQAYVDGKEVEYEHPSEIWMLTTMPAWNWNSGKYRIKPTKTLRPWTADEVPLGAWLRHSKQGRKAIIMDVTPDPSIGINGSYFSPQFVLAYCEHSLDGGKTWLPCGVEEESK